MWGALIGAGASLLGGLFGGGSKKQETTTTNHVDYGRMVRDAEAAGFNPLTALRNGGAAGFSVSTGTTPATPLSARLADGVAGATQSFLANFDPFKDQKREMEFKLVEAQLANLQADTSLKTAKFGQVPTYTAGNMKKTMGSGVAKGQTFKSAYDHVGFVKQNIADLGDYVPQGVGAAQPNHNPLASQPPETVRPERVNPYPSWMNMERNPWTAGGDAAETSFGDAPFLTWPNALNEFGSDVVWNLYRYGKTVSDGVTNKRPSTTGKVLGDLWNGRFKAQKSPPLSSSRKTKQ